MQAAFEETLEVFDTKDLEQKEDQELLARKCMSLAMECIRAHIFVAIDCGEEQMKPAIQNGTARFATKKEIAETYVQVPYEPELWRRGENLPAAQGLVLGSMERAGKLYALVDTGDVHCLMIGAAGVGKTAHFLYPNIEYACACGMSFLTTDTKGDLYRNYAGIAKKYYGYHTAVIDLRNPTRSDSDNMLHLVNKYMDEYLADQTDQSD